MKFVMNDARGVGQHWEPICQLNNTLQSKYNAPDIHAYRYYLQQNTQKVMQDLAPVNEPCKKCPVCNSAIMWKPNQSPINKQIFSDQEMSQKFKLN
jgi:hypothetical protein